MHPRNNHTRRRRTRPLILNSVVSTLVEELQNNKLVPYIPRALFPIHFIYISQDELVFSLHPNQVLSYEQLERTGGHRRRNGERPNCSTRAYPQRHKRQRQGRELVENNNSKQHNNSFVVTEEEEEDIMNSSDATQNEGDPIEKVFGCFGILEHILSFSHPLDILSASAVNQRFHQAGRQNSLWKEACKYLWKTKIGVPILRRGNSLALFWRTMLRPNIVKEEVSVRELKALFLERPLGRKRVRDSFSSCFEKNDIVDAVLEFMPQEIGENAFDGGGRKCTTNDNEDDENEENDERVERKVLTEGFRDLWFGSFVSSVIDSKRTTLTLDELLDRKGFLMHFKIMYEEEDRSSRHHHGGGGAQDRSSQRGVNIRLLFHCNCYFGENGDFRMDDAEEPDVHHPEDLKWHWTGVVPRKAVQVSSYPPLIVSRLDNWGWKLENQHVVLYSH